MGNTYSRNSYSELVSQSEWQRRRERGQSHSPSPASSYEPLLESPISLEYPGRRCWPRILSGGASDRGSDISPSHSSQARSDQDYMYPHQLPQAGHKHSRHHGYARSSGRRSRFYSLEELEVVDIFEVLDQGPPTLRPGDEYLDRPDSNGFRPRRIYNPHTYSHPPPSMPTHRPSRGYGQSFARPDPHPGQPWYPPPHPPPYDAMAADRPPKMPPSYGQQPRIEYREPRLIGDN